MDNALRYQELIGRGYSEETARHIVAKELNDDQLLMMQVCGLIEEPRLRYVQVRYDDAVELAGALGIEPGTVPWHKMTERVAALVAENERLNEWRCPSCEATTRARMADQEPEYCTCEPKPSGEAPDEPDRDCPVHGDTRTRVQLLTAALTKLISEVARRGWANDHEVLDPARAVRDAALRGALAAGTTEGKDVPLINGEPAF